MILAHGGKQGCVASASNPGYQGKMGQRPSVAGPFATASSRMSSRQSVRFVWTDWRLDSREPRPQEPACRVGTSIVCVTATALASRRSCVTSTSAHE